MTRSVLFASVLLLSLKQNSVLASMCNEATTPKFARIMYLMISFRVRRRPMFSCCSNAN